MMRWWIVGALLVAGCSETKKKPPPEPPPAPEVKRSPLTKDWFGAKPALPAGLPALGAPHVPGEHKTTIERASYRTAERNGRITAVILDLEPDGIDNEAIDALEALVTSAWGPGEKSIQLVEREPGRPGTSDQMTMLWFDPAARLRAMGYRDNGVYRVRFEPYLPVATLLGAGHELGYFDRGLFGKSYEELKTLYPDVIGIPPLPTEYGALTVSVTPAEKVTSLRLRIAVNSYPLEKYDPTALIRNKWETPSRKAGTQADSLVVRTKAPYVEVVYPKDSDRVFKTAVQLLVAEAAPSE